MKPTWWSPLLFPLLLLLPSIVQTQGQGKTHLRSTVSPLPCNCASTAKRWNNSAENASPLAQCCGVGTKHSNELCHAVVETHVYWESNAAERGVVSFSLRCSSGEFATHSIVSGQNVSVIIFGFPAPSSSSFFAVLPFCRRLTTCLSQNLIHTQLNAFMETRPSGRTSCRECKAPSTHELSNKHV